MQEVRPLCLGGVPISVNFRESRVTQSSWRGVGGTYRYRFWDAASQAGMQGAQPLPGGLGVSPSIVFLLLRVSPQAKRAKEAG